MATDPVGGGLIASLARPGGNVTGLSMQATDLASKRVELLHQVVPKLGDLAILANVEIPQILLEIHEVETAAQKFNLKIIRLEVRRAEDLAPAFASLNDRAQALYVCTDPLTVINRMSINTLASAARLPAIYGVRDLVVAGGLMSYGADFADQFRRTADLTDKILHGTKPGDIPVEQPTKFDFVINLKDRQGARHQRAAESARARRRGDRVRRREFIVLIGGALSSVAGCGPAQQQLAGIGVLMSPLRPRKE